MNKTRTVWTNKQQAILEELYPTHTCRQIAEVLGKTKAAITMRAIKCGLKKPTGFKYKEPEYATELKRQRQLGKKRGPLSLEHRRKIGMSQPTYGNRDLTNKNEAARKSFEYKEWRKAVFERDDYTCQKCNVRGGELNADHIKPFALFIKLRYELSNGRTLCVDCHRKTPTWGKRYDIKKYKADYGTTF